MSLLSVEKVIKSYDGVLALNRVSLHVRKGTIMGLIGPNGAGKSTLFHLITGVERPTSGRIYFKGIDITSMESHEISLLGVGRTFQTLQVWGNMTVVENILTGMHTRLKGEFLSCGLWLPWIKRAEERALKEAKEILEFLGLLGRWKWPAFQLSFGQQKMLEMGRALAMKPELLLLDEPAAGLTPAEVGQLSERICQLREKGITTLVVEHHMGMVMEIAVEVAVLHNGELIAEGSPDVVRRNPRVIETYLKSRGVDA
ncbi:MAG: ABC transporter ATP-binding protein [Deltaproteobacteria bacterium]|nr:ABC transporter ATP-binding protein [Deltaproteobacteria bacterium]